MSELVTGHSVERMLKRLAFLVMIRVRVISSRRNIGLACKTADFLAQLPDSEVSVEVWEEIGEELIFLNVTGAQAELHAVDLLTWTVHSARLESDHADCYVCARVRRSAYGMRQGHPRSRHLFFSPSLLHALFPGTGANEIGDRVACLSEVQLLEVCRLGNLADLTVLAEADHIGPAIVAALVGTREPSLAADLACRRDLPEWRYWSLLRQWPLLFYVIAGNSSAPERLQGELVVAGQLDEPVRAAARRIVDEGQRRRFRRLVEDLRYSNEYSLREVIELAARNAGTVS